LPKRAPVSDLPAFDRLGRLLVARIRGQLVFLCPTSNAGPIGLKLEASQQFAGGSAVRTGRLGTEQLGEQIRHLGRPKRGMIASREAWDPTLNPLLNTRF